MKMNIIEINKRIKQRPPFQMIERVEELVTGQSAVGIIFKARYSRGHSYDRSKKDLRGRGTLRLRRRGKGRRTGEGKGRFKIRGDG